MRGIPAQSARVFNQPSCSLEIIGSTLVEYPELVNALVKLEEFTAIGSLKTKNEQAYALEVTYSAVKEERKPVIHAAMENAFIVKSYELEAAQWLETHQDIETDNHSLVAAFFILAAKAKNDVDTLKYQAYFPLASLLLPYKNDNAAKTSVIGTTIANLVYKGGEKNGNFFLPTSNAFQQLFKGYTINYNRIKIVRDRFFEALFRTVTTNNTESPSMLPTSTEDRLMSPTL